MELSGAMEVAARSKRIGRPARRGAGGTVELTDGPSIRLSRNHGNDSCWKAEAMPHLGP
jgi:hypothetical protein